MYFKANFSHIYISLLRKHETLQDAFIHSSSGPPNTCLRQFCEKIGAPAFLTLHKTHEGDYPCQRNREISVSYILVFSAVVFSAVQLIAVQGSAVQNTIALNCTILHHHYHYHHHFHL